MTSNQPDRSDSSRPCPGGRWRMVLVQGLMWVLALAGATLLVVVDFAVGRWADASDAFMVVTLATVVYWFAGLAVSLRLTGDRHPVPSVLRWAASASSRRAEWVLTVVGFTPDQDDLSAWSRGVDLAVRRDVRAVVSSGLGSFYCFGAFGPFAAVVLTDSFHRSPMLTVPCLIAACLLFLGGFVIGNRRGETTATRVWSAVEGLVVAPERPGTAAGVVALGRHARAAVLAGALHADLTTRRLVESDLACRRATGTRDAVLSLSAGPLGVPANPWTPQLFQPLLRDWITGRWDALPHDLEVRREPRPSSLPRMLAMVALGLGVLGGAAWYAQILFDDWVAVPPVVVGAVVLARLGEDRIRGAVSRDQAVAALERAVRS